MKIQIQNQQDSNNKTYRYAVIITGDFGVIHEEYFDYDHEDQGQRLVKDIAARAFAWGIKKGIRLGHVFEPIDVEISN